MAKYLVQKSTQKDATRYIMYEAEIEVAPGEDVDEAMENLPRTTWREVDDYYEDDYTTGTEYKVLECLVPDPDGDPVHGTPADFGLEQTALVVAE